MKLRGFKWDTQIGDTSTLAPFALVLRCSEWNHLALLAELLAGELFELEAALVSRADLWPHLGLPRSVLAGLRGDDPWTPSAGRVVRFDFHRTGDGWQISEVNSDVPGGFNEAGLFSRLMAGHFPDLNPAGDPLADLASALAKNCSGARTIGFVTAPGVPEDYQVAAGVARALRDRDFSGIMLRPEQLSWCQGSASAFTGARHEPLGGIYRFFQGEWLGRIPLEKWRPMVRGGLTPVCNPGSAILSESKRLPLLWRDLGINLPTWRALLPNTQPPFRALMDNQKPWVLKKAYSNNGEAIVGSRRDGIERLLAAMTPGRNWVAQRRFDSVAIDTPAGPMHPCIGVFVIERKAAGIYARISPRPVIDYLAIDVATLLHE
ncbi:MAG TPA: glutathionylspermidine synthase family protein [Candidatus Didemnitutus sp.]